jgi:hypothetical protein
MHIQQVLRISFSFALAVMAAAQSKPGAVPGVHVWQKHEITLKAERSYPNPYVSVDVWVDLAGPGFKKRVYGFWDGGSTFRVRVAATAPGVWSWTSGSNTSDPGLNGKTGTFRAVSWSDAEKDEDACRRGFVGATPNQHAFQYADGTPYYLLGDTWWAVGTFRFPWADDDATHPMGPNATFKDYVRFRKSQGFNAIAMIVAFPAWAQDGKPYAILLQDAEKTCVRNAWPVGGQEMRGLGTATAKDMHNEGGLPFFFPGRVPGYEDVFPDVNRINPAYFQYIDRKIDYLNSQGFVVFMEVMRRDTSQAWKKYYGWPDSYARYIQYVWSRYQANNMLFSPVHFDSFALSIPPKDYSEATNLVLKKYGRPPFGTLVSTNSSPTTLIDFGEGPEGNWVTFNQSGNFQREHHSYWFLTDAFFAKRTLPALNGEPYYSGRPSATRDMRLASLPPSIKDKVQAPGGSERDSLFVRSALYGNFLSGGLAGYIYGAEGIWGAETEPSAPVKMWDAFQWDSANYLKHLRTFALWNGKRYQDLVPNVELVLPNSTHEVYGFEGWAYGARTQDREFFLVYYEKDCPSQVVRGAIPGASYEAKWFDPRTGAWSDVESGLLKAGMTGWINIPRKPSDEDWGLRLVVEPHFDHKEGPK